MKDYMKLSTTTMVLGGLGAAALLYMIFKPKEAEAKGKPPTSKAGQPCDLPDGTRGEYDDKNVCVTAKSDMGNTEHDCLQKGMKWNKETEYCSDSGGPRPGEPGTACSTAAIPSGTWNENGVCVAGKP